jgi:hypothetical protein
MKKISIRIYKGIEYIQLSALPVAQAESLKQTLNERTLIKILMDDVILHDCVLYSAYEKWFASNIEEVKEPVIPQSNPVIGDPVPVA